MSRILIVDDDDTVHGVLSRFLAHQGYEVESARNGRQGVDQAWARVPDVILMDVVMPEMDGIEACRLLRGDPRTAVVPILMLSGKNDRGSRLKGIEAGANDYLSKPIDLQDLDLRVRNSVRMKTLYDQLQAKYAELAAMKELRDNLTEMLVADNRRLEAVVEARGRIRAAAEGTVPPS